MESGKRLRRHHSAEFKARVVSECERPGAVIAAVARTHGVGAKLVRLWRRQGAAAAPRFVPINVETKRIETPPIDAQPLAAPAPSIQIDVRRTDAVVEIRWPLTAADACAAWLRGWLA